MLWQYLENIICHMYSLDSHRPFLYSHLHEPFDHFLDTIPRKFRHLQSSLRPEWNLDNFQGPILEVYWTSSRYPWWDIETLVLGYGGAPLCKKILPDTEFYSNTFINHAYEPFFCILLISTHSADTYFPCLHFLAFKLCLSWAKTVNALRDLTLVIGLEAVKYFSGRSYIILQNISLRWGHFTFSMQGKSPLFWKGLL